MITSLLKAALVTMLLGWACTSAAARGFEACLPTAINLDMIALPQPTKSADGSLTKKKYTVKMRLTELKARCQKGKLVDSRGRQIRFYSLIGCWGNPPENYLEMLQDQTKEIERLERRYRVIQIPCNQSVDLRTISRGFTILIRRFT